MQGQAELGDELDLLWEHVEGFKAVHNQLVTRTGASEGVSWVDMHDQVQVCERDCTEFEDAMARLKKYMDMLRKLLSGLQEGMHWTAHYSQHSAFVRLLCAVVTAVACRTC